MPIHDWLNWMIDTHLPTIVLVVATLGWVWFEVRRPEE